MSQVHIRVTVAPRRLAVHDNGSLSVFAISLNDCNHCCDLNSPFLMRVMFRLSSVRWFPFEPTMIALSNEISILRDQFLLSWPG